MSKGAISAAMVAEAFKIATSEGGQFFNGMESSSKTFSGVLSTLQDNVSAMLGTMFAPLMDILMILMQVGIGIVGFLQPLIQGFVNFVQPLIQGFANFVVEHAEAIKVVLLVVGAVAVGFAIKWVVSWAMMHVQTLITAGLIIASISAVVLIVVGIIKVLDYFGISVDTVLGFVGGIFGVTFALINNALVGTVEIILGFVNAAWNGFATLANFVGNVFTAPVTSVIRLFENLANSVLGILKGIASALDAIFGSSLASTVAGWQENVTNKANQLIEKYAPDEQYNQLLKPVDLKASDFGLERKDYSDSWKQGMEYGEGLGDKISGALDSFMGLPSAGGVGAGGTGAGAGGFGDPAKIDEMIAGMGGTNMDDLAKEMSGVGKGVKGVDDKLSGKGSLKSVGETKIVDENLKYLMDIATVKYQRGYQATSPQINVNVSTGDINNGMDANRLFSQFENIIVDAVSNNLTRS